MSCSSHTQTPSSSENGDGILDPNMLSLPGDKTPQEARIEQEGCIRTLQVFRYNLYQKESKVNQCDAFADLLYFEEELRRNCQEEIVLRQNAKTNTKSWDSRAQSSFENEISRLKQKNWIRTRSWWWVRGWIVGNSGPLSYGDLILYGICIPFLLRTASLEGGVVVVIVDVVSIPSVQIVQQGCLVLGIAL